MSAPHDQNIDFTEKPHGKSGLNTQQAPENGTSKINWFQLNELRNMNWFKLFQHHYYELFSTQYLQPRFDRHTSGVISINIRVGIGWESHHSLNCWFLSLAQKRAVYEASLPSSSVPIGETTIFFFEENLIFPNMRLRIRETIGRRVMALSGADHRCKHVKFQSWSWQLWLISICKFDSLGLEVRDFDM